MRFDGWPQSPPDIEHPSRDSLHVVVMANIKAHNIRVRERDVASEKPRKVSMALPIAEQKSWNFEFMYEVV